MEDFEGGQGAESDVGEKVTFKRGKMSEPIWGGGASGVAFCLGLSVAVGKL